MNKYLEVTKDIFSEIQIFPWNTTTIWTKIYLVVFIIAIITAVASMFFFGEVVRNLCVLAYEAPSLWIPFGLLTVVGLFIFIKDFIFDTSLPNTDKWSGQNIAVGLLFISVVFLAMPYWFFAPAAAFAIGLSGGEKFGFPSGLPVLVGAVAVIAANVVLPVIGLLAFVEVLRVLAEGKWRKSLQLLKDLEKARRPRYYRRQK